MLPIVIHRCFHTGNEICMASGALWLPGTSRSAATGTSVGALLPLIRYGGKGFRNFLY
jgi:hypothetical protein